MGIFEILCILVVLFFFIYYYCTMNYDFWKVQGVLGPKPSFPLGNFQDVMLNRKALGDYLNVIYKDFKDEAMVGIFARTTPVLILRDPEYIKDVLIKDFTKFPDRGLKIHEKVEPLSQHLFNLESARWKPLRKELSPVFTSGKLKEMFYLLLESSNHLEKYLDTIVSKNEPIECRDLTAKFTANVIGSCAFGININSLRDEENEFLRMGKKIFATTFRRSTRMKIRDAAPWLFRLLGPIFADRDMNDFFTNLIINTMKYRKNNNIVRHDFVDLISGVKENHEKLDFELTDSMIASQAFVFFIAGFETSSTTMSHALYELALNTSIQDKLREEINDELRKNNGKLSYESIKNMKYLDKIFNETLRKYPPVTVLMRQSTEKYTFSGTNVTIPKGSKVWIPIYAIQRDAKYYPDPEMFDPERFDIEFAKSRHPMLHLPFGDGPRNCIGARFAIYQTKVGLIKILKNFRVDVCEKTPIPYVNNPRGLILQPIGGIFLKFSKMK